MIVHFLSGENSLLFLLYQPAFENISKIRLLGSNNEYKRLVGYHSLIENRRIDVDFLIDRYTSEESIYLRRSIIWLMGYSKDEKSIYNFLSDIYEEAPWRNKLEVLRTMKRLDINLFNKFIKYHNIDIGQFNGI